jgi:hypothetical protein
MRMPDADHDTATQWSVHVDLGRCTAADRAPDPDTVEPDAVRRDGAPGDASGRRSSFDPVHDRAAASVSLRHGIALSTRTRDWIVAGDVRGQVVPHDVHLTVRDQEGRVVSRWCLRHAGVARFDGAGLSHDGANSAELVDLTIDELVLTCERIDLEPTTERLEPAGSASDLAHECGVSSAP